MLSRLRAAAAWLLAVLFVVMAAAALPSAAAAHHVERGIIDGTWVASAPDQRVAIVKEANPCLTSQHYPRPSG